jgi:hypothetical protein
MPKEPKDGWDKLDILLRPMGAAAAMLIVAIIANAGSDVLNKRQIEESNQRLFTQLLTSREQSESHLRKEMLAQVINAFLKAEDAPETSLEKRVLGLELLASNFHDSVDLGPLFSHVSKQLHALRDLEAANAAAGVVLEDAPPAVWSPENLLKRLSRVAQDVTARQLAELQEVAFVETVQLRFSELDEKAQLTLFDKSIMIEEEGVEHPTRTFHLKAFDVDMLNQEVLVHLVVKSNPGTEDEEEEFAELFHVGAFDFPMIDNTRLSGGDRFAVVVSRWGKSAVDLDLAHFPASRASVKEKRYYEDVVKALQRQRESEED